MLDLSNIFTLQNDQLFYLTCEELRLGCLLVVIDWDVTIDTAKVVDTGDPVELETVVSDEVKTGELLVAIVEGTWTDKSSRLYDRARFSSLLGLSSKI
jgi:hypothetical protein